MPLRRKGACPFGTPTSSGIDNRKGACPFGTPTSSGIDKPISSGIDRFQSELNLFKPINSNT